MKQIVSLMLVASLFCSGCKSVGGKTVPDIDRIAAIAKEAAAIGTSQALIAKPELKVTFLVVENELGNLANTPTITVEQVLNILNGLPVKLLKGKSGQIAISTAKLVIAAAGWSEVNIVRAEQLRPIVIAIRDGMLSATSQP